MIYNDLKKYRSFFFASTYKILLFKILIFLLLLLDPIKFIPQWSWVLSNLSLQHWPNFNYLPVCNTFTLFINKFFIRPSVRRDVLWYTNVRLSVRFTCRAVNWEPLGQFTSNFAKLLELIVLWSVYFLVKFQFFIPELWDFVHQIVGDFSYVVL